MNRDPTERGKTGTLDSGLVVTDLGLQGLIFETTPAHHGAVIRHERVVDFIDTCIDGPAGGMLLLLLPINDMVINLPSLKAAVDSGTIYSAGTLKYLEWQTGSGWQDRRELSNQTAWAIERNDGCQVTPANWRWAREALKALHPDRRPDEIWTGFIADAQAWWVNHATGPIFSHAAGLRSFQLISRAALARRVLKNPQLADESSVEPGFEDVLAHVQTVRTYSKKTDTFDALILFSGQIARDKRSKDSGRKLIIDHIKMALPLSAQEGRVQVIVLGGIRHAIQAGGVHGRLWAPVTVYEYLRQGIKELVIELLKVDIDDLDGWSCLEIYKGVLKGIQDSQRMKFAAFLEAFHRFLVIAGVDPLPCSLCGNTLATPPSAKLIWHHELELAISFIKAHSNSPQVELQAILGLVLAFRVPIRSIELWCIRVGDVHIKDRVYLTIYARRRDGVGKTKSLRRQEDVDDKQLMELLIDMVRLRRDDGAIDEDVLFGQPGEPDARHEEILTVQLMNSALRWASGDASASFYDLRHACFSRRAEAILSGASTATDVALFQQLSAQGGHAGPSSTMAYIHLIEHVIAQLACAARPKSAFVPSGWEVSPFPFLFEDVGKGILLDCPPKLDLHKTVVPVPVTSAGLLMTTRADIAWRISQNILDRSVAGACSVPVDVVGQVLFELVSTMVQVGMVDPLVAGTARGRRQAINAWVLWARAARQAKNEPIARSIEAQVSAGQWPTLHLLWHDWVHCHFGDDIAVVNPRPATRFVQFLLSAGVERRSLIIVSRKDAQALSSDIGDFKIKTRLVEPRKGLPAHRLFMAGRGIDGSQATGATISVVGCSWWMLMLGSMLLARGEI